MKSRSFSIWAVFSTPLSRYYIKNSASGGFAKPLLPSPTGTGLWNNSCVFFHMFPRKRLLSARATLRFQCPPSIGYLWVLLAVLSPIMGIVSTGSYCWFPVPFRNYDNPALGSATQPRQADSIRYVIARYKFDVTASKYRKSKRTSRVCFLLASSFSPHAPAHCAGACFLLFLSLGAKTPLSRWLALSAPLVAWLCLRLPFCVVACVQYARNEEERQMQLNVLLS